MQFFYCKYVVWLILSFIMYHKLFISLPLVVLKRSSCICPGTFQLSFRLFFYFLIQSFCTHSFNTDLVSILCVWSTILNTWTVLGNSANKICFVLGAVTEQIRKGCFMTLMYCSSLQEKLYYFYMLNFSKHGWRAMKLVI